MKLPSIALVINRQCQLVKLPSIALVINRRCHLVKLPSIAPVINRRCHLVKLPSIALARPTVQVTFRAFYLITRNPHRNRACMF